MKKSLFLIFILLIIFAVSACGPIYAPKPEGSDAIQGGQVEEEEKEVYYLVGMHIILPYWQDHRSGFEAAGEELGVKAIFTGENGNDALRQIDLFEQAVKADPKPKGILVSPIDKEAMIGPINDAIAQGIPVICIDNDAPGSNRLTYIGTDNYRSGYLAADIIGEKLGGAGDVGILTIPGLYSLDERQRGFEECLAEKYPGIKVVAVSNDEADPSVAANMAGRMLDEYPTIAGLFGTDAASGVGAAIALDEKGKMGVVKVVAFDKDSSVLELVEQGKIEATLVQRTFTMSYYGLKLLYDYNHNGKLRNQGISMLPNIVDTGIIVVTKDNVNSFY